MERGSVFLQPIEEQTYQMWLDEGAHVYSQHPNMLALRGARVPFCNDCRVLYPMLYMVHRELWRSVVQEPKCYLCIGCLEARLGRSLTLRDFTTAAVNREIRYGYGLAQSDLESEEAALARRMGEFLMEHEIEWTLKDGKFKCFDRNGNLKSQGEGHWTFALAVRAAMGVGVQDAD